MTKEYNLIIKRQWHNAFLTEALAEKDYLEHLHKLRK